MQRRRKEKKGSREKIAKTHEREELTRKRGSRGREKHGRR
jgi:hypothetical protein